MIVIKIGGGEGINYEAILSDIATLDTPVIIVHGGNAELNKFTRQIGKEPRMLTFDSGHISRYNDEEGMELFEMVYCGKINSMIVQKLHALGMNPVGLSGLDGSLIKAKRKETLIVREEGKRKVIRDDLSGKIEEINVKLLSLLLEGGYTPVISPPALSHENQAVNVDGDLAAAMIASTMGSNWLIILSNVPGLLADKEDPSSLIEHVTLAEIDHVQEGAKGRMKIKVHAAREALEKGVRRVIIGDARIEQPVTQALGGKGTHFSQG